jgi:hypothetical protein
MALLATIPLGAMFGWSGHPAIPDAPLLVYVALYAVLLPGMSLMAGWRLTGRIARWVGSRAVTRGGAR